MRQVLRERIVQVEQVAARIRYVVRWAGPNHFDRIPSCRADKGFDCHIVNDDVALFLADFLVGHAAKDCHAVSVEPFERPFNGFLCVCYRNFAAMQLVEVIVARVRDHAIGADQANKTH